MRTDDFNLEQARCVFLLEAWSEALRQETWEEVADHLEATAQALRQWPKRSVESEIQRGENDGA